jgi:L-ascorbate metabolism protein UlaG (beta-lactamase superfamily)
MKRSQKPFRSLCMLILLVSGASAAASRHGMGADVLQTADGPVALHIVHHASFVLNWNGKTIYVDPTESPDLYKGLGAPDLILITHAHGDHLSPSTLAGLDTRKATVVMPQSVADKIGKRFGKAQLIMANGDTAQRDGIIIHAMPMYNLPQSPDAYHPKGWGNGYVLTLGGKRIYISGDTSGISEMRALKHIDLAFVCMNLPYTMDVEHAADAVLAFKPKVVYPYHYRGQDVREFKRLVSAKNPDIEVRLRDWYAQ